MNMETKKPNKFLWMSGVVLFILVLGLVDWKTGYELNFFVFYFLPVAVAAWFFGVEAAVCFSIVCAFVWFFADKFSGHYYSSSIFAVWNTLIRLFSFVAIGWSVDKINVLLQSEKIKAEKLELALSEIKILRSFLSICCVCKKIREDDGNWQPIESYISHHSDTKFSHGYCPDCGKKAMEQVGLIMNKTSGSS